MTAAGSVERHIGLPSRGRNLPPRDLICTSPWMSSIARSSSRFSWCLPKKDSSDQDVEQPDSSQAQPRGSSMRMIRSVCGFGRAPCAISSWPAAELSIISSSPDFRTRPGRPLRFFATLRWGFIVNLMNLKGHMNHAVTLRAD